jgi:hypothetical protein
VVEVVVEGAAVVGGDVGGGVGNEIKGRDVVVVVPVGKICADWTRDGGSVVDVDVGVVVVVAVAATATGRAFDEELVAGGLGAGDVDAARTPGDTVLAV